MRLERLIRERPHRGHGRTYSLPRAVAVLPELHRLDAGEQRELVALLGTAANEPCALCARSGYDIARLTDDQKRRTLRLLRTLLSHGPSRAAAECPYSRPVTGPKDS